MDENSGVPCFVDSIRFAQRGIVAKRFGHQSGGDVATYYRRLDLAISCLHSRHNTAAEGLPTPGTHPVSPHAWAVCVFLRRASLHHLSRPGSEFQFVRNVGRRREAQVCDGRLCRVPSFNPTRHNFDLRNDSASGREAVAGAASSSLCIRNSRRDSLLLAGEVGRSQAALLRRTRRNSPFVARLGFLFSRKRKRSCGGSTQRQVSKLKFAGVQAEISMS